MLALNGADPLNGPRQWGSLLFCLVIVLSLQRAEGSTEETGSSYTKIRILPENLAWNGTPADAAPSGNPTAATAVAEELTVRESPRGSRRLRTLRAYCSPRQLLGALGTTPKGKPRN